MRIAKAFLMILTIGLFGCATTGVIECNRENVGKYRCHWWHGLGQCTEKENGTMEFTKFEPKCSTIFEPVCGWREKLACCEKYKCAEDGSLYECERWCGCECDLENHPEVKNQEKCSPTEEIDWSRIVR